MRMFVAIVPPSEALEDLAAFVEPRREAGSGLRWTIPAQWHLTLAFMAQVADRHVDELHERLRCTTARRSSFAVKLASGGAFPNPGQAKVLYAGVETDDVEIGRLATGARAAAAKSGAGPAGGRFHPHVTLARISRPLEATRWLRVLASYRGLTWKAEEVALIASHLSEGPRRRPRYEVVAMFPLGGAPQRSSDRTTSTPAHRVGSPERSRSISGGPAMRYVDQVPRSERLDGR